MALEIDHDRVRAAADRIGEGGWSFSPRQLYYAVCSDVEVPAVRIAPGEVGLGAVLILVGIIIGQRIVVLALVGIGFALIALGAMTHLRERRPQPLARLLAISFADFERRFLSGDSVYQGLVADATVPSAGSAGTLVVCDRTDTAAVLAANRERLGDIAVYSRGDPPTELAGRRVIALHDCDPAGCALVAELRDAGAEVVDAGINPRELIDHRAQLLEGAPARLPRDLSGYLDAAETDWLRAGRRLECATETPVQLAQRLRGALEAD
jgi:hypothetical protein